MAAMEDDGTWASELVFALVGPIGTDLETVEHDISSRLASFGYEPRPVRISSLLPALFDGPPLPQKPEHDRLNAYMTAGTAVRERFKRGDALALLAASSINGRRPDGAPAQRVGHIIRSLKHPKEVETLRQIYGPGFFLIGVWSPRDERTRHLVESKSIPLAEAEKLIRRDQAESAPDGLRPSELGQRTRDTFKLADVFVRQRRREDVDRFLDLVFGNFLHTPGQEEHAMFLAYAASLRSGDLSRQVGAVVLSQRGDVIGMGANDAPRVGGGLYWPGSDDRRDIALGQDANASRREEILSHLEKSLRPHLSEGSAPVRDLIHGSALFDLTEFGRPVHAEMEALSSCLRAGVSPVDGTLLATTFPCHNCAKHIVAAGIRRVVFVEAYPKSLASELHEDAIEVVGESPPPKCRDTVRVRFEQFSGVGPRRFFDLFSLTLSSGEELKRKSSDGKLLSWRPRVRVPMFPTSYLERENAASQVLRSVVEVKP